LQLDGGTQMRQGRQRQLEWPKKGARGIKDDANAPAS
jgi:hypothetical protein